MIDSRFWSKVNKEGPIPENRPELGPCWLWTDRPGTGGYARYFKNPKSLMAHRFAYEEVIGKIPRGLILDHLCRVRHCVRPSHLEPVTHQVNILRGIGLTAQYAQKTHCRCGRPYDLTYTRKNGRPFRDCHACAIARSRRYERRGRAQRKAC